MVNPRVTILGDRASMDALFILVATAVCFWTIYSFGFWGLMLSMGALIAFGFWNHQRKHKSS